MTSVFTLELDRPLPGTAFNTAVNEAADLAERLQVRVAFKFNGYRVYIEHGRADVGECEREFRHCAHIEHSGGRGWSIHKIR